MTGFPSAMFKTDLGLQNQTLGSSTNRLLGDSIAKTHRLRTLTQELLDTTDALLLGVDGSKTEVDVTSSCLIQNCSLAQSSRQNFLDTIVINFFHIRRRLVEIKHDVASVRRNRDEDPDDDDGMSLLERLDGDLKSLCFEVTELESRLVKLAVLAPATGSACA